MSTEQKTPTLDELKKNYLTTLQPAEKQGLYNAKLVFTSYTDYMCKLASLIEVTRQCSLNTDSLDKDTDIANVLDVVIDLLPFSEMEFLDRLRGFECP